MLICKVTYISHLRCHLNAKNNFKILLVARSAVHRRPPPLAENSMALVACIKQPHKASSSPRAASVQHVPRMRTCAFARALSTGFVCWAQKKYRSNTNATEIWLFIEMGLKIPLSGEIGIRETNARSPFRCSLCCGVRWYPASCICQRKTTTTRRVLWRRWSEVAASARMREAGPKTL